MGPGHWYNNTCNNQVGVAALSVVGLGACFTQYEASFIQYIDIQNLGSVASGQSKIIVSNLCGSRLDLIADSIDSNNSKRFYYDSMPLNWCGADLGNTVAIQVIVDNNAFSFNINACHLE